MSPTDDTHLLVPPWLQKLGEDWPKVRSYLRQLALNALEQELTLAPVFVAAGMPVAIGLPAIDASTRGVHYHYRISLIEELIKKGLVGTAQRDEFRERLGDQHLWAAVMVINEEAEAHMVFLPYRPLASTQEAAHDEDL